MFACLTVNADASDDLDSGTGSYTTAAPPASIAPDPLQYVAPSRNFKTLHISLDLDLDLAGQKISGSVTHTLECLRANPQSFDLNCVGLTVSKVTVDGQEAKFSYPVAGTQATSWLEYSGA